MIHIFLLAILCFTFSHAEVSGRYWKSSRADLTLLPRALTYNPTINLCGPGASCSEACGEEFETCPSIDSIFHCFNPSKSQACCNDGSGKACDSGYYCTDDTAGTTRCCPNGMTLAQCSIAIGVSVGPVTSKQISTTQTTTVIEVNTITEVITTFSSNPFSQTTTTNGSIENPKTNSTAPPTPYTGDACNRREYMELLSIIIMLAGSLLLL